jgi:hypothetical protein
MFGHAGYGYGTSVFAFFDEDRLVVRTERFKERPFPKGISGFYPGSEEMSRVWVGIELDDSLAALRAHWNLIEESYASAVRREESKRMKSRTKESSPAPVRRRPGK